MSAPLFFSVVTPSLNQGRFIEKTILSVLSQRYPAFEHIIVDGGSNDDTLSILKKYEHLKWTSEKDEGKTQAINKGFKQAKGDIIAWVNSDDYYAPNIFSEIANWFNQNPSSDVLIGRANVVDAAGKFLFEQEEPKDQGFTHEGMIQFWKYQTLAQPALFFRRSVFQEIGYLNEKYESYMDYDFLLRLSKRYSFARSKTVFAFISVHPDAGSVRDMTSGTLRKQLFRISRAHWGKAGSAAFWQYAISYAFHWPMVVWRSHYERFAFEVRRDLHIHFSHEVPQSEFLKLRRFFFRFPFPFIVAVLKSAFRSIRKTLLGAKH